jgi:hypothetical protein
MRRIVAAVAALLVLSWLRLRRRHNTVPIWDDPWPWDGIYDPWPDMIVKGHQGSGFIRL